MREYHSREDWYRRLPIRQKILLRASQRSVAGRWRNWATRAALRGVAGIGSVAAAGAANYFVRVPRLNQRSDMLGHKRSRREGAGGSLAYAPGLRNDGGFNTYVRGRITGGKRMRVGRKKSIAARTEIVPRILRFSAISPYSGTKGYFSLMNYRNTVSGNFFLPVHLYDMTAIVNNVLGTVATQPVGFAPYINGSGGAGYQCLRGSKPDGTDYAKRYYVMERWEDRYTTANEHFGARAFHCWTSIKLVLYSMLTTPTRFTIQMVTFNDVDIEPLDVAGNVIYDDTVTDAVVTGISARNQSNDVANFYADMMKPYVFNPIATQLGNWRSKYRVIKSKDFIVQPRSTINSDTSTPNTVELNWFHNHNTVRKYLWETRKSIVAVNELQNDDDFQQVTNQDAACNVDPSKRVYLMIKAQALPTSGTVDWTDDVSASTSNTTSPSYDILIRQKYYNA